VSAALGRRSTGTARCPHRYGIAIALLVVMMTEFTRHALGELCLGGDWAFIHHSPFLIYHRPRVIVTRPPRWHYGAIHDHRRS
jgi:hypothetical protein